MEPDESPCCTRCDLLESIAGSRVTLIAKDRVPGHKVAASRCQYVDKRLDEKP
jgi:hypothetical protein